VGRVKVKTATNRVFDGEPPVVKLFAAGVISWLVTFLAHAGPLPQLKVLKLEHYTLHSDLEDSLLLDAARRMEVMYAEYSRRMSDFDLQKDDAPLDVYLFNRKVDYVRFTGNKYGNTGGVFLPGKNQLVAYLEGQRDTLRRTLQHEAFHQFAVKAIGPQLPIYLNEGLAQIFEEAIYTGDRFLMGQIPPRRLRQLQDDIENNNLLPLKTLTSLTPDRWAENLTRDQALGSTQYNQSWAIVHFMAYGDAGRNGARLVKMLRLINQDIDPSEAFAQSFGHNIDAFAVALNRYILALKPSPEAELIDRHEVLADLLVQFRKQGKHFKNVAQFRKTVETGKYRMQYKRGEVSWVAEPGGYFKDPAGKLYTSEELYFSDRHGAVMPDLVLRDDAHRIGLTARFYQGAEGRTEFEVLVRPGAGATVDVGR
jgi:hypothetical protein